MQDDPRMSAKDFAANADEATLLYFRKQLGDILSQSRMGAHSPTVAGIGAALAKAQAEFTTPKKNVPVEYSGRSYKYADLQGVYDAVRPALAKHGLAITHLCQEFGGQVELVTMLLHGESGEWLKSIYPVKAKVDRPQEFGSAMTYAKRYAISALLGVASENDDDAQRAQDASRKAGRDPELREAVQTSNARHGAPQAATGPDLSIMSPQTGEIEWSRQNVKLGDVREFMRQLETACQHSALYWAANGAQARALAEKRPKVTVDEEQLARMVDRLESQYGGQVLDTDDPDQIAKEDPARLMV